MKQFDLFVAGEAGSAKADGSSVKAGDVLPGDCPRFKLAMLRFWSRETHSFYETRFTPGGCHVPSPAGRIDGGVVFGQYRRITR